MVTDFWMISLGFVVVLSIVGLALYSWKYADKKWPYTVMLALSLVISSIYVTWRIGYTLDFSNISDGIASALLLMAELLGIVQFAIFGVFMYQKYRRPIAVWPSDRPLPSVDIFVATYNENTQILTRMLAACHRISYPKELLTVYICDDGGREEVEKLTANWGAKYLARPSHEHAKAGNLNYALAHSDGELVLTLDADMVPKPNIVRLMIGHFADSRMGFVQAPQVFYNPDPYQHNLPWGRLRNNDQDYFMREMLPRRDRLGAVMYIGSNAMFSRKALAHIGGFITGSITEDLATGLVLQAEKFRCVYCDAVVATGLAPESFGEMVNQRVRWCRGNIQVFRQHNLLSPKGLSFWQRIAYISGTMYWYFGVQKLIFVVTPMFFLFFGVVALHTTLSLLLMMWTPFFLSQILTYKRFSERKSTIWWSHVQELALMPFLSLAAMAETFKLSMKGFRVTNKGMVSHDPHTTRYFWILVGFALMALAGFVSGLDSWTRDTSLYMRNSLDISLGWDGFNLAGLIFAAVGAYERPRPRSHERRRLRIPARLMLKGAPGVYNVTVEDISESGVHLTGIHRYPGPLFQNGELVIENYPYPVLLSGWRRQSQEKESGMISRFHKLSPQDYERLVELIYGAPEPGECPSLGRVGKRRKRLPQRSRLAGSEDAVWTPGDVR